MDEISRLEFIQRQINEQAALIAQSQERMGEDRLFIQDLGQTMRQDPRAGLRALNIDYADMEQRVMGNFTFGHADDALRYAAQQNQYAQNPWNQQQAQSRSHRQGQQQQATSFANISSDAVDGFMTEMRNTVSAEMYRQNRQDQRAQFMGMDIRPDYHCENDRIYMISNRHNRTQVGTIDPVNLRGGGLTSFLDNMRHQMMRESGIEPDTLIMSYETYSLFERLTQPKPKVFVMAKEGKIFEDQLDVALQAFSESA